MSTSALFITTLEAAKLLDVDTRTVRDMFKSGLLKGFRHRHTFRISRASIEALAGSVPDDLTPVESRRRKRAPSEHDG